MKRYLRLFMAVAVLSVLLSGCGKGKDKEARDGREQVTIAFWSDQLTEQYGAYLRDAFPEVDFTFYVATNSADFYDFKEKLGDLPDILTIRRFALRDVADWRESLLDLSDTELANALNQSYLRSYTYDDGTVNWLPVCAEVDSIIINETLLAENGIAVPTNYEEFVTACNALRERNIRPFISNFAADYTCMEVLQGFAASHLTSQKGREWRQRYESGQTNQLDEVVWLPAFERMEEIIDCAGINAADLELEHEDIFDIYTNGEVAMVRGTGDDVVRHSDTGRESVLAPYYGETEEENWYLTYPAFQVAASSRAEERPERKALILDIMEAMLNEAGQRQISANQNMVPYSSSVTIDLSPAMAGVQPYIDSNRLYIRLASADMFSISRQVVQGMVRGEYPDARAAFDAFNEALQKEVEDAPIVAHIENSYLYTFDPEEGSQAASAVMNTVRESVGTQLLIGPAASVAGNIVAGDYTEEELGFLTMGELANILTCQMTGEQIYKYVDYVLTTPDKRGSVINDSALYVTSGFEMAVRKSDEGYVLDKLTINGGELDRKAVYSVAVIGNVTLMLKDALAAADVEEYTQLGTNYKQTLVDYLVGGGRLAKPGSYISLQ